MNVPILFCICSPSQMIFLVLKGISASIPLCIIDTSQSISLPATHIILPMYWICAPFNLSNFTCIDDRISLKRLRACPAVYGFIIRCMTWYPRHQRCLDFTNTDLCNCRITSTIFWSKLFVSVLNLLSSRASSASF